MEESTKYLSFLFFPSSILSVLFQGGVYSNVGNVSGIKALPSICTLNLIQPTYSPSQFQPFTEMSFHVKLAE